MRRVSTVMAVAALDTYMHRLVVDRAFTHQTLPGALASLTVSFEQLLAQADDAAVAARKARHNSRPRVSVKRQLRDRLLRETFQRSDDISRALGMAGRSGLWTDIAANMAPPMSAKALKARLDAIVVRRNQIVHEGDYQRLERPRFSRRNGMTHAQAAANIDFVARLIDAIHGVA